MSSRVNKGFQLLELLTWHLSPERGQFYSFKSIKFKANKAVFHQNSGFFICEEVEAAIASEENWQLKGAKEEARELRKLYDTMQLP